MKEPNLNEIRVFQSFCISRFEYDAAPSRFEAMAEDSMRREIAHFIQSARVKTTLGDEFVEKRLELFVATPEQFWRIVKLEAEKAARWMGRHE